MKPLSLLLALVVVTFAACKQDPPEVFDFSADYAHFPLELDQPKFYALDSIVVFRTTGGVRYDTARLEVRETLVETFTAPDGTETFRGERWDRRLPDGPWRFRQTFTAGRSATTATRTEDNLSFTKLVFPIRQGKTWDGHAAFDDTRQIVVGGEFVAIYQGWNYRYIPADDEILANSGFSFPSEVAVVEQDSTDNLIATGVAYEVYAPGIGLIERYIDARRTQCNVCCGGPDSGECIDLPWNDKAEKGFVLRETFLR